MKNITIMAAMAISMGAMAQRPDATLMAPPLHGLHFSADRTPTDTLIPLSFADTTSQIAFYGFGTDGYLVGTNTYDAAMAQKFQSTGSVFVEQLLFVFAGKDDAGQPASVVHARVYGLDGPGYDEANNAVNNAPGTVLGNTDVPMSDIDTSTAQLVPTFISFNPPAPVSGDFAAGFDFSDLPATAQIGLFSTVDGDNMMPDQNWEKTTEGDWIAMGDTVQGWGIHFDFFIFAVIGDGVAGINDLATFNNMRMSFVGGNPANSEVTVAYEMLKDANARLTVMDGKGANVVDQQLGRTPQGQHQTTLDVSGLANGTYYVTLFANGNPLTKKLVVQH